MRRRDNRWTVRVTEWPPRNGKRRQNRQRTRRKDEIESFAGVTWNRQAADRVVGIRLGDAFWNQRGCCL